MNTTASGANASSASRIKAFCDVMRPHVTAEYFRLRQREFELQRMLVPQFFAYPFQSALELGCGIGFKCLLMKEFADQVEGIDLPDPYHGFVANEPSAVIGQRVLTQIGCPGVSLMTGSIRDHLRANPNRYDLIYSDYLFEHVPDLKELCHGIYSALRPGARTLHAVPNTHDALIQLAQLNLSPFLHTLWQVIRARLSNWKRFKRANVRRVKINGHGWFEPGTHSEYISDFHDQFEIYRLENYVFTLMEAGLRILAIHPTREHTFSVFAEKPAAP